MENKPRAFVRDMPVQVGRTANGKVMITFCHNRISTEVLPEEVEIMSHAVLV